MVNAPLFMFEVTGICDVLNHVSPRLTLLTYWACEAFAQIFLDWHSIIPLRPILFILEKLRSN